MRLTTGFVKLMVLVAAIGFVGVSGCAKQEAPGTSKPATSKDSDPGSKGPVGGGVETPMKTDDAAPTSEPAATKTEEPKTEEPKAEPAKEEAKKEEPKAEPAKEEAKKEEPKAEPAKEEAKKEEPKAEPAKEEAKKEEPAKEEKK